MKERTATNPFEFVQSNTTESKARRLDYTPALIDRSNQRASELMVNVGKKPELFELANKAIDGGNPQDLIELIKAEYNDEQIKSDATLLDGCDEEQLSRLLESRRSDRSKAKAKNPRSNVQVCRTYIASMYAELLIRIQTNKPYTGQSGSTEIDIDSLKNDQEALSRKVKSLQSKASRLRNLAKYDTAAAADLEETEQEIARLNSFRPNTRTQTKIVVKDANLTAIRDVLKDIDPNTLPEAEREKLLQLMAKLG